MKEYAKKSANISHVLNSTSSCSKTASVASILQVYRNGNMGSRTLQTEGLGKIISQETGTASYNTNKVSQGYFEPKPWEPVDVNSSIQDAIDNKGYEDFSDELKLGEDADGITFGMELEVVHSCSNEVMDSIKAAKKAELTTATKLGDGSPEKWRPTWDGSLETGDSGNTPENPSAVEWVSPIFEMDATAWQNISDMCRIIRDHNGSVNDSCSEHIHVGHKRLSHDASKFDVLFEMYTAFQDVIDIIARSNSSDHSLRPNAEAKYASMMEKTESRIDPDFKKMALYKKNIISDEVLQDTDKMLALISSQEKESLWSVHENLGSSDRSFLTSYIFNYNRKLKEYKKYISEIKKEGVSLPELTGLDLTKTSRKEAIESMEILCKIADLHVIFKSYVDKFNINPILLDNRYNALNVTQNFQQQSKPTVEMRRFNPTIAEEVIQANVLLSTLLMLTATQDQEIIKGKIALATETGINIDEKAAIFIELISYEPKHIDILSKAYATNKASSPEGTE